MAQILAVIMERKRPRLEMVGASGHHSAASAVQPPVSRNTMNEPAPEHIFTIKPTHPQPPASEFEFTHKRPIPLPLAIDVVIGAQTHAWRYWGHGQSKVVYRSTDEPQKVLKLTATQDHEPQVCRRLSPDGSAAQPAVKIFTTIYAAGRCEEQDQWGRPKGEWFAWLAEYATPLDKYMQRPNADRQACLKIALYKQVLAAQHGLLLSDNNLFNFGVVDNTVVIIDIGSRALQGHAPSKGTMNTAAIANWWKKLAWQCKPNEADECRSIWQSSYNLDEVAQKLCKMRLCPASNSVEQPVLAITQAPSVWALLEEHSDTDATQWLLEKFLWGRRLTSLKLLQTGETIPLEQEEEQPAHIRLEIMIKLTEHRRSKWIRRKYDILSEETLQELLQEWKDDYSAWMNRAAQARWHRIKPKKRHEFERTRFRNFLFKMCGCYEFVIFWLRVQASWTSLRIFQDAFGKEMTGVPKSQTSEEEKAAVNRAVMNNAVEAVRRAQAVAVDPLDL